MLLEHLTAGLRSYQQALELTPAGRPSRTGRFPKGISNIYQRSR